MTDLNLIQFDIHVYYINRYICRLPFITHTHTYIHKHTYIYIYRTYMWYTYIKQIQIFYWICKMIVYVNNYNIVFISRYK